MSKILFLFSEIGLERGGIEAFNFSLVRAAGAGKVIALSDCGKHGFPAKVRFLFKTALHLFTQNTDLVVCGHVNLAPAVSFLCLLRGVPYAVVLHGMEAWDPLPSAKRKALARAKFLMVVSRYTRDRCAKANHLPLEKFVVVPNTVDGEKFSPGPKPAELADRFHLHGKKVLLSVGRLDPRERQKGMDTVIRALPLLRKEIPAIHYLIVGTGADAERLQNIAAENKVTDLVTFAGRVSPLDLPLFYRAADCYVMPSSQEGFGIVYLEALASGLPVIAGKDGASDPLKGGELGWQVPSDSPSQVAEACLEALSGKDPRCRKEWLRSQVLQEFGWAHFQQAVAEALFSPRAT